jgi:hypothetical protein
VLINLLILRVITIVVRKIDQKNDSRLNHGFFKVVMHVTTPRDTFRCPLSAAACNAVKPPCPATGALTPAPAMRNLSRISRWPNLAANCSAVKSRFPGGAFTSYFALSNISTISRRPVSTASCSANDGPSLTLAPAARSVQKVDHSLTVAFDPTWRMHHRKNEQMRTR